MQIANFAGPSLFNTRLPQPAREAQLLHEAYITTNQRLPVFPN